MSTMSEPSAAASNEILSGFSVGRPISIAAPRFAHPHVDVLGVQVSAVDMEEALNLAARWIDAGRPGYACFACVFGVMEAQRDPKLRGIMNRAAFSFPDGRPMTWLGQLQGLSAIGHVPGPEFMLEMCRVSVQYGYRHFLYGGKLGVAEQLSENLRQWFPGLKIVGAFTPPFRPLTSAEEEDLFATVRKARPHILWVGLGTPKQDRFMAQYVDRLQVPLLAGVGAAFDFHTGSICDSPRWVKRAGLQWLHRLLQEPRRLWRRYLLNNPVFLWRVAGQLLSRSFR